MYLLFTQIGVMLDGRLLVERQPNDLFTEHGSTNLEEIVLNLSRKNSSSKLDGKELAQRSTKRNWFRKSVQKRDEIKKGQDKTANPSTSNEITENKMATMIHEPELSFKHSLVRIRALVEKNFVVLFRNPLCV